MQALSKTQLLEQIQTTLTKTKVIKLTAILQQNNFYLPDLIDLTFHPLKKTAFRAAWLLENMYLVSPASFTTHLTHLVNKFALLTNESCKRHYAKVSAHLTSTKTTNDIKNALALTDLEPIVSTCFDWLIDPKVLVAVKVFAAETLFNLTGRYTWIAAELKEQLNYLMRDGSAAIQSRGRKMLEKL